MIKVYHPWRSLAEGGTTKPKFKTVIHTQMTPWHPSRQSLVEGYQKDLRLRLVGAFHLVQQCCTRGSWRTQILDQYGMEGVRPETLWPRSVCPPALQPGTTGIAGTYCKYKMACWCTILWDMMQQAIICSSWYLGPCIMKSCITFMIP